jgi:hypothetical protein
MVVDSIKRQQNKEAFVIYENWGKSINYHGCYNLCGLALFVCALNQVGKKP